MYTIRDTLQLANIYISKKCRIKDATKGMKNRRVVKYRACTSGKACSIVTIKCVHRKSHKKKFRASTMMRMVTGLVNILVQTTYKYIALVGQ